MSDGESTMDWGVRARDYAQAHLAPQAAERDRSKRFPADSYSEMAELGLLGVNIPRAFGGSEAGVIAFCAALTEVAQRCAATAVGMSVTHMVAETIARFGTAELAGQYVPRLVSGEAVAGAFCLTEPGAGSDAGALRATAVLEGDEWVINGAKMWITSAAFAGVFIVMARTGAGNRGISAFVVPAGTPGLSVGRPEDKCGLRGSNTAPVAFEDCRVPADHLLAKVGDGFGIAMTALDGGRITIGAMANGITTAAVDAMAAHLAQPRPHGTSAAAGQGEIALADAATALEGARLMVARAAALKDAAKTTGRRFTREAAMAKLFATETAQKVTQTAVSVCGRGGLRGENLVERLMRDARVTVIFEGTSEIQRVVLARQVLDAARRTA